jgi:hypothetical protein
MDTTPTTRPDDSAVHDAHAVPDTHGRPHRRGRRPLAAVAALAATAILATAAHAVTPTFDDVPADHPFFYDIAWMAGTGISEGYPDGTYRPGDPVTRQAMAAFLQRLYALQDNSYADSNSSPTQTSSTEWVPVAGVEVTLGVPDGTMANLYAQFSAESTCHGASGYCSVRLMVQEAGEAPVEMTPTGDFAFDSTGSGTEDPFSWESHSMLREHGLVGGGVYTVWPEMRTVGPSPTFRLDESMLMVTRDLTTDYAVCLEPC